MSRKISRKKIVNIVDGVVPSEFSIGQGEDTTILKSTPESFEIDKSLIVKGTLSIEDATEENQAVTKGQLDSLEESMGDNLSELDQKLDEEELRAIRQEDKLNERITIEVGDLNSRIDSEVGDLNERIDSEVSGLQDLVSSEVGDLNERIDSEVHESQIQLESLNERIDSEVSVLDERITTESSSLSDLISNEVGDLNERVSSEVGDLNSRIDSEVSGLDERINSEVDSINERVDSEVGGLRNLISSEVSSINGRVDSEVSGLNERLDSELGDLNERVSSEVGDLNSRIDSEVSGLDERISRESESLNSRLNEEVNDLITLVSDTDESLSIRIDEEVNDLNNRIDLEIEDVNNNLDSVNLRIDEEVNNLTDLVSSESSSLNDRIDEETANLNNRVSEEVVSLNTRINEEVEELLDGVDSEYDTLNKLKNFIDDSITSLIDGVDSEYDTLNKLKNFIDDSISNTITTLLGGESTYDTLKKLKDLVDTSIDNLRDEIVGDGTGESLTLTKLKSLIDEEVQRAKDSEDSLDIKLDSEIVRATGAEEDLDDRKLERTFASNINNKILGDSDYTWDESDDSTKITKLHISPIDNTTYQSEITIPKATAAQSGLQTKESVQALSELISRVGSLESKTSRYIYSASSNPTSSEIDAFVRALGKESPYEGVAVVVKDTYHIWHYYENDGIGWRDDGSDTVITATQTLLGIVKGSEDDGKIYVEDDGTMSLVGYDGLVDADFTLDSRLTSEISRATTAESTISNNLASEVTRATTAESTIANNLSSEITRSKDAETVISNNLAAEITRSKDAETVISNNLASEVTRATTAESALSSSISDEVTRATTAESTISSNLSSEISRATTAESALSSSISDEVTRATTAESTLDTKKLDKVVNSASLLRVYGVGLTGDQLTLNVSSANAELDTIPRRIGTVGSDGLGAPMYTGTPTAEGHATNRKYVDTLFESAGKIDDVKVDGVSVVSNKVANITSYDDSSLRESIESLQTSKLDKATSAPDTERLYLIQGTSQSTIEISSSKYLSHTIPVRNNFGTFNVGDPSETPEFDQAVIPKRYLDERVKNLMENVTIELENLEGDLSSIDELLDMKLNKVTNQDGVIQSYGVNNGAQTMLRVSEPVLSNSIAYRDQFGRLSAATPVDEVHLTTKKYVDDIKTSVDDTKLDKVTSTSSYTMRLYTITSSGGQGTVPVGADGAYASSIARRSGVIGEDGHGAPMFTGTPTADGHATNKKYVDDSFALKQSVTVNNDKYIFPKYNAQGVIIGEVATALQRTLKVNGTDYKVYGDSTTGFTTYSPITAGTANQILLSSGTGAPDWANQSVLDVRSAEKDSLGNIIKDTYVNLAGAQSISGAKTFTNIITHTQDSGVSGISLDGKIIRSIGSDLEVGLNGGRYYTYTTSNFRALDSGARDLGASGASWRNLYLSGKINDLTLPTGTKTLATLDDIPPPPTPIEIPLPVASGGTGITGFGNNNSIVLTGASSTDDLTSLLSGASGHLLKSNGPGTKPGWISVSDAIASDVVTGVKGQAEGGYRKGNVNLTLANLGLSINGSTVTGTAGIYAPITAGTANQILLSSGTGAPDWADGSTKYVTLDTAQTISGEKNFPDQTRVGNKIIHIGSYYTTGTPLETLIKTKIVWRHGAYMPVIHLYGYAYGLQSPIELKIGFYVYDNKIGYCGATNMGAWYPTIYLYKYVENSTEYVAIGLSGSCYYLQFALDLQEEFRFLANVNPKDWVVEFNEALPSKIPTATAMPSATCVQVPYKPVYNPYAYPLSGGVVQGVVDTTGDLKERGVRVYSPSNPPPSNLGVFYEKLITSGSDFIADGLEYYIEIPRSVHGILGSRVDIVQYTTNGSYTEKSTPGFVMNPSTGTIYVASSTNTWVGSLLIKDATSGAFNGNATAGNVYVDKSINHYYGDSILEYVAEGYGDIHLCDYCNNGTFLYGNSETLLVVVDDWDDLASYVSAWGYRNDAFAEEYTGIPNFEEVKLGRSFIVKYDTDLMLNVWNYWEWMTVGIDTNPITGDIYTISLLPPRYKYWGYLVQGSGLNSSGYLTQNMFHIDGIIINSTYWRIYRVI